jgi:hypothetical protein
MKLVYIIKNVETPYAFGRKCANNAWAPPYKHLKETTWFSLLQKL